MSRFYKGPAPCEVCGDRVDHKNFVVVGRRPSGLHRLVHVGRCHREFVAEQQAIEARWVENRVDISNHEARSRKVAR